MPVISEFAKQAADTLKEGAERTATATLGFLGIAAYLGVSVANTTDEQLLVNGNVNFPIVNAGLACRWFYVLAPLLLVALHINLLLDDYFLGMRIGQLRAIKARGIANYFSWNYIAVALGWKASPWYVFALRVKSFVIYTATPLALLLWMEIRFLPYHSLFITRAQRLMIFADLAAIFFCFVRPRHARRKNSGAGRQGYAMPYYVNAQAPQPLIPAAASRPARLRTRVERSWPIAFFVLISCLALWLSVVVIRVPDSCDPGNDSWMSNKYFAAAGRLARWIARPYLNVAGKTLAAEGSASGRDLSCADFRRATLAGFDFRGARLGYARFDHAMLGKAKFGLNPATGNATEDSGGGEQRCAEAGVDVGGGTDLRHASFDDADLTGADLSFSRLDSASFRSGNLTAASFKGANANQADFTEATGAEVIFSGSCLRGATLLRTVLVRSWFTGTHAEVANFMGSRLVLSHFDGASLVGSDLRYTWLHYVNDIELDSVDLRGAQLGGVNLRRQPPGPGAQLGGNVVRIEGAAPNLNLVDMRYVQFEPLNDKQLAEIQNALQHLDKAVQKDIADDIRDAMKNRTTAYMDAGAKNLIYRFDGFGQPLLAPEQKSLSEDDFYGKVSWNLVQRSHENLVPFLVKVAALPGSASKFDEAVACALLAERDRRKLSSAGASQEEADSFLNDHSQIRALRLVARNCASTLAQSTAQDTSTSPPPSRPASGKDR
jgi:uncharacterized protein YjbI with pentapeptide repeats